MLQRIGWMLALTAAIGIGQIAFAQEHDTSDTEHVADEVGHAASVEAEHGAAGHGEGHLEGDERLVPIPASGDTIASAIWVIVIFLIMLAILYPTAWKNVLAGLKKREERIRKDIADAEAARARAEQTLKDYSARLAAAENEVRELINKATADAERAATGIRTRAQQESEEIKERALKDIDAAGKQAMAEVYEQTATLATGVAEKILRRNLNADDQRDLVNQSLEQLQTIKG